MVVRTHVPIDEYRSVYTAIPKVANSSIKARIIEMKGLPPSERPHARESGLTHITPHNVAGREDWFRFTFVRNPWDRAVSLWSDKCGENSDVDLAPYGLPRGIGFDEFVRVIAGFQDKYAEIHFKSQASLLMHNNRLLPDFVGRFERLNEDWARILKIMDLDPDQHGLPHHRASTHKEYRSYYTPFLAQLVEERYGDEIRLFGYRF